MAYFRELKGLRGEIFPSFRRETPRTPYGARGALPFDFCGICNECHRAPYRHEAAAPRYRQHRTVMWPMCDAMLTLWPTALPLVGVMAR